MVAAMAVPVTERVRRHAAQTIEASNLRQIVQASLIHAHLHDDRLPGTTGIDGNGLLEGTDRTPHLHAIAAAMARTVSLDDQGIWFSDWDTRNPGAQGQGAILVEEDDGNRVLDADFAETHLSFQYVAGLTMANRTVTPVAFTRGLDVTGYWLEDQEISVYGRTGGHVGYLGGNIRWYGESRSATSRDQDSAPDPAEFVHVARGRTANVLETITAEQAIYSTLETPTGHPEGLAGQGEKSGE